MKYLVTGATGFVGSWVAQRLVEKGEQVAVLVRRSSNLQWLRGLPVQYHYGSLLEPDSLKAAVAGADNVLHIAGVTKAHSVRDYYSGNVQATQNLLEVVRDCNPRIRKFVHISSQAAVGPSPSQTPLQEDCAAAPITDYGRSKLQSEAIARSFADRLPVTILRPSTVYGPRDTDVYEVFKNVKKGINLTVGRADQLISIIHVKDLADAIILSAENPAAAGQTYFVANEHPCRWSEVVAVLEQLMNRKTRRIAVPVPLAYGVGMVMEWVAAATGKPTILNRQKIREVSHPNWVVSSQKIKRQLGFTAQMDLASGFQDAWQWYCQQGWL